ncbi:MAG: hypothetical protein ABF601_10385 [Lacticaseibacillus paracasei]|uniref:hypothetical protein n=1 Tax=Lactobacillaceae TaxID=33958 RepID=UPI001ED94C81|nr:hypothetical protein [Lacticaseibacillus paracasei]
MPLVEQFSKALKVVGLFLFANIETVLFLCGFCVLAYAAFSFSLLVGQVASGMLLVATALVMSNAKKGGD